jgi:hypothetical protein
MVPRRPHGPVRVIGVTTAVFGVASVVAIIVMVQRTSVC